MAWTEADLQDLFPPRDWERGVRYFCQGAVQDLQIEGPADYETVQCVVQGTRAYHVEIHCAGEQAAFSCTCPRYRDTHSCKHAAAAMLAYFRKSRRRTQSDSDFFVKQMLRTYADRAAPQQGQIRLAVQLHRPASRDYPTFSLRVGADKLYNVRDIRAFAGRVARGETFSYGKGLSFCHTPEQFDLPSQALIALLLDQFPAYRAPDTFAALLDPGTDFLLWPQGQKNRIRLLGSAFDRWFDLLREQPLAVAGETDPIALADGNPPVVLSLQKQPSAAALRLSLAEGWTLFGNARHCYALNAQTLLRCDAAFCARLQPLLRGSAAAHRISYADLPVFCSCVLPELEALVEVRDPDGLLQTYLPDPCTMVFYLDLEGDTLRMSVALRYGETEVPLDDEVPASIKRNLRAEQTAGSLAAQYFRRDDTGAFQLSDFDAAFAFLTGALAEFQRQGEVYLSERLRARRLQPSPAHVGISVSEGLLRLDLDTGGFPPEELEGPLPEPLKKAALPPAGRWAVPAAGRLGAGEAGRAGPYAPAHAPGAGPGRRGAACLPRPVPRQPAGGGGGHRRPAGPAVPRHGAQLQVRRRERLRAAGPPGAGAAALSEDRLPLAEDAGELRLRRHPGRRDGPGQDGAGHRLPGHGDVGPAQPGGLPGLPGPQLEGRAGEIRAGAAGPPDSGARQ